MNLDRAGREFMTFTTSDSTGGTLAASFDGGATWAPLTILTTTTARCLVAGPDAVSNPVGTTVLPVGTHEVLIKFTAGSEVIIRLAPDNITVE